MNEQTLSLPLKVFNDKVRVMNQTQKRDLLLTAVEARNLHAEIFSLLSQISELTRRPTSADSEPVIQIGMDGGGFK